MPLGTFAIGVSQKYENANLFASGERKNKIKKS
jgi:hypothetical protein